jgi:hypothetical protein
VSSAAASSAIPTGVQRARALTAADLAWIAAIPCALVTALALVALGPLVGDVLFRPSAERLWPPEGLQTVGQPEPDKLGRYVIAVLAPLLTAGAILLAARRPPRLRPRATQALVLASQALLLAFVAFAVLGQHGVALAERPLPRVFGVGTILAAGALAAAGVLAMRQPGIARWVARLARETPGRRAAGPLVAGVVAAAWLLDGLITDGVDGSQLVYTVNTSFAVLDGRTPLVDLHPIYAKLLPYAGALAMAAFGTTALVYTIAMGALSTLSLVAAYAVLRRIVSSSLLGLALFVPFVALSDLEHPMLMTAMFPMRYGGAYLMAWLVARRIDRRDDRSAWPLFAVGGVVALNELEFGMAALVATLVALVCASPPRSRRAALRLGRDVVSGSLVALVAISLLTLLRAGALPDPAILLEWPRIFTRLGWFARPMPPVSLHLAVYATFAAAVLLAAVRLQGAQRGDLLTSMLAWGGVFGLLAGSYYVGNSDEGKLATMYSAWAFALVLLTIASVRALAARRWRRPSLAEGLVLLGFCLAVCSIARLTPPQDQIARLADEPPPMYQPAAERFIRGLTQPGQKVAILMPIGHRFSYELGLDDVFPYETQDEIVTRSQLQLVLDMIRRERVHDVFLLASLTAPAQMAMIRRAGFSVRAQDDQFVALGDD